MKQMKIPVEIFLDGGVGNRMNCLINGMALATVLNVPLRLKWCISKHMRCSYDDVFEEQGFQVLEVFGKDDYIGTRNELISLKSHYGTEHFQKTHYLGWSHRLIPSICKEHRAIAVDCVKSLKFCDKIKNKACNLNHSNAYVIRTRRIKMNISNLKLKGTGFLTTDNLRVKMANKHLSNNQNVFGESDFSNRNVEGIQEAFIDWLTLLTAGHIYYNDHKSTFTEAHEFIFGIPRTLIEYGV